MSETQPEVPPPRYTQPHGGGHKHLICDEQEWLARPASWGIGKLPDDISGRKQNLFDFYFYSSLTKFVQCPVCQPLIQAMFTETGLDIPPELATDSGNIDTRRTLFRARYTSTHPSGNCDAAQIMRAVGNYEGGLVTRPECYNRIIEELFWREHQLDSAARTIQHRQQRIAKNRELALELVGPNPFRPITFSPSWRTDTALTLARQMYESRDFGAMPILADALQDAGCEGPAILDHCRDVNQVHVRGCWVVDLALGK